MPVPVGTERVATSKVKAVLCNEVHLPTVNVTHLHVLCSFLGLKSQNPVHSQFMTVPLHISKESGQLRAGQTSGCLTQKTCLNLSS